MASCCAFLVSRCESALKDTLQQRQNPLELISAMLDGPVTELTNYSEACSIPAGLAWIGPKIQWIDQCSSHSVGRGTRAHKTAGNRA